MITIMEGDPGVGKSFLAMQLAVQVSIGGELPDGQKLGRGRVLYLSHTNRPDDLRAERTVLLSGSVCQLLVD